MTYWTVSSKDSCGVWRRVKSCLSKISIKTVSMIANTANIVSVVPMIFFTLSKSFFPMPSPINIVPPRVSPVIRLVMIWVTCVPVETAATLSAPQYFPTTKRSTAPYKDCRILAIRNGTAKKRSVFRMLPSVSVFCFIWLVSVSCSFL